MHNFLSKNHGVLSKTSSISSMQPKEYKNEAALNTPAPNFSETQQKWLQNYLENVTAAYNSNLNVLKNN